MTQSLQVLAIVRPAKRAWHNVIDLGGSLGLADGEACPA